MEDVTLARVIENEVYSGSHLHQVNSVVKTSVIFKSLSNIYKYRHHTLYYTVCQCVRSGGSVLCQRCDKALCKGIADYYIQVRKSHDIVKSKRKDCLEQIAHCKVVQLKIIQIFCISFKLDLAELWEANTQLEKCEPTECIL